MKPTDKLCVVAGVLGLLSAVLFFSSSFQINNNLKSEAELQLAADTFTDKANAQTEVADLAARVLAGLANQMGDPAYPDPTIDSDKKLFQHEQDVHEAFSNAAEKNLKLAEAAIRQKVIQMQRLGFYHSFHTTGIVFAWLSPALFILAWLIRKPATPCPRPRLAENHPE